LGLKLHAGLGTLGPLGRRHLEGFGGERLALRQFEIMRVGPVGADEKPDQAFAVQNRDGNPRIGLLAELDGGLDDLDRLGHGNVLLAERLALRAPCGGHDQRGRAPAQTGRKTLRKR
jgi:hypothetical protein